MREARERKREGERQRERREKEREGGERESDFRTLFLFPPSISMTVKHLGRFKDGAKWKISTAFACSRWQPRNVPSASKKAPVLVGSISQQKTAEESGRPSEHSLLNSKMQLYLPIIPRRGLRTLVAGRQIRRALNHRAFVA